MEYSARGQGGQGLVLPETELLDPAAHTVHSADPAAVLYVPAAQEIHEGEFIPPLSCPASHPSWKVSSTSGVPPLGMPSVTSRRVIQSEESFSGEGKAALLPWSLKSLGRAVGIPDRGVMENFEMMTGCWNDI